MYKNGYVACIKVGGKHYNGDSKEVHIPFDSEYEILLKNKNSKDCVVDVYIDGKKISQYEFIIRAHSQIVIERFVENVNEGQKLKFVPLDDDSVSDKKNRDNGEIEVRFYPARNYDWETIKTPELNKPNWWFYSKDWATTSDYLPYDHNNFTLPSSLGASTPLCYTTDANIKCSSACVPDDAGATVDGGKSYQNFGVANLDVDRSNVTVIKLKLKGTHEPKLNELREHLFCANCGQRRDAHDNFCPNCGQKY